LSPKIYFLLLLLFIRVDFLFAELLNEIDLTFVTFHKIISDFQDSLSFKPINPYYLHYNNKLFYFSSEVENGFRFEMLDHDYLPDFRDHLDKLYIFIDQEIANLSALDDQQKVALLIEISQKIYIDYLKTFQKEASDIPPDQYPSADVDNQALATLELKILHQAYIKSQRGDTIKTLELLKKFYAIRKHRWKHLNSFVQTYEGSQEKILGMSFYEAFQLLQQLEKLQVFELVEASKGKFSSSLKKKYLKILPSSVFPLHQANDFINHISTLEILNHKLHHIQSDQIIHIESMSRDKAEMIGFLLYSIYRKLGWEYQLEARSENFHSFLGTQLNMRSTEIDSVFQAYMNTVDLESLKKIATVQSEFYLRQLQSKQNFNLEIITNDYLEEFYLPLEQSYFLNSDIKVILPFVPKYKIKSPQMILETQNLGLTVLKQREEKKIQLQIHPSTVLNIDYRPQSVSSINATHFFSSLSFTSGNVVFKTRGTGFVTCQNNNLKINILVDSLSYNIEKEYLARILDLNEKLVSNGVPGDWLKNNINHEKFRLHPSVVRYYYSLPEHQVGRGERDENWYRSHFGVDAKIKKGITFRRNNLKSLREAEKRHGIHYELLLGILALESDYANPQFRGNFYTFNTLVSQFIYRPHRENYSLSQLVALYQFTEKSQKETFYYIGSFAGAVGWGQFIPTSLNTYFISAKREAKEMDIFNLDDALHSISNYLAKNGLNSHNINNRQARFKAIRSYNHSDAYANAVLHIYDELRKTRPK